MSKLTYEQVAAVADQLDANGIKPTAIKVREVLGRGSYSTITAFIEQWQPQQTESDIPPVPDGLTDLLPAIWAACYQEAAKHAQTQIEAIKLDCETANYARQSAMQAVDELEARITELETENQRLTTVAEVRQDRLDSLLAEKKDLQIQLSQRDGLIQGLKDSLTALKPAVPETEPKAVQANTTKETEEPTPPEKIEPTLEELNEKYPHLFTSEGLPITLTTINGKLLNPANPKQSWNGKGKAPAWYSELKAVYAEQAIKPPFSSASYEGMPT
ncbi:MAG: DNA-binding protein [Gammaproteobacteria bacterium]